jgi:hypothetical protein
MASRNYAMAYDTPYNEKLLAILRKYNMERDTNGEPNNMHQMSGDPMTGGAFLASDGAISRKTLRHHPHLSHPLSGAMAREMGDTMLGSSILDRKFSINDIKNTGRELFGMGVMSGGLRPPGMVSPYVQSASPGHMVVPGTMATYPVYNAVEMRAMNGGFFLPAAMALGRIAGPAIASAAIGALASKGMDKILGSGSASCASCEAAQSPCGCGAKKKRGRKKGGSILDRKFSINEVKDTGRQLLGLGILDEKFSINDIGRTGKQLLGMGKKRGRPKGSKGKMKGGLSFKDVTGKVGSLLGEVASVAKPVIKDVAISMGKEALSSYLGSKGSKAPVKRGKGVLSGGLAGVGVMKGGAMDGRKRRAEIVKKVMKEHGMKMTDASKYVKQHGLYK